MAYTVVVTQSTSGDTTLGTGTPFIEPSFAFEYDDQEPAQLTQITETWVIQGVYVGASESAADTNWDTLRALFNDRTNQVTGVKLLRGANTVENITVTGGAYEEVKVTAFQVGGDPRTWTSRIPYTLVVQGIKKYVSSGVVNLTKQTSYAYDESGLVTKTCSGSISTAKGTSAETAARAQGLSLPDGTYGFVTGGTDGVDVIVENRADTKASFASIIRQTDATLPSDVGPSYDVVTVTTTTEGETTTTTSVQAVGTGAEAAVDAARPTGQLISETKSVSANQRFARATYVQGRSQSGGGGAGKTTTIRQIVTSGGGYGLTATRMSGGRFPILHRLSIAPFAVNESFVVTFIGNLAFGGFKIPEPLNHLHQDFEARTLSMPTRVSEGATRGGDRWQVTGSRRYMAETPDVDFFTMDAGRGEAEVAGIEQDLERGVRPPGQGGKGMAAGLTTARSVRQAGVTDAPAAAGGRRLSAGTPVMQFTPLVLPPAPGTDSSTAAPAQQPVTQVPAWTFPTPLPGLRQTPAAQGGQASGTAYQAAPPAIAHKLALQQAATPFAIKGAIL